MMLEKVVFSKGMLVWKSLMVAVEGTVAFSLILQKKDVSMGFMLI